MKFKEYVDLQFQTEQLQKEVQNVASILTRLFTIPSPTTSEHRRLKAHDNTEMFWTQPDSPLLKWLSKHGIKHDPSELPSFAQGGVGRAYFIPGNNYVVKMSANRVEANVAKMVAGRDELPTVVIDVTYLDNGIYAILQHYVNTNPPKEIKDAADYLTTIIINNPNMQQFPTNKKQQEEMSKKALSEYGGGSTSLIPSMLLMMDVINQLYHATGFFHNDAGPTNVGIHQGKIVIPDLGPNEPGDFDSLDALAKIQKNRRNLGLDRHDSI